MKTSCPWRQLDKKASKTNVKPISDFTIHYSEKQYMLSQELNKKLLKFEVVESGRTLDIIDLRAGTDNRLHMCVNH